VSARRLTGKGGLRAWKEKRGINLPGSVYERPPPPSWRRWSLTDRRDDEVGDPDPLCLDGS